jgi:hypothetical protein
MMLGYIGLALNRVYTSDYRFGLTDIAVRIVVGMMLGKCCHWVSVMFDESYNVLGLG